MKTLMPAGLTFAALSLACGGASGGGGVANTSPIEPAELTEERMARMVLDLEDLGAEYGGWQLNKAASGVLSNERMLTNDWQGDEAQDQARFRRVTGYAETYRPAAAASGAARFQSVTSAVHIYEDAGGAAGSVEDHYADESGIVGRPDKNGDITERLELFDPGKLADKAWGAVLVVRYRERTTTDPTSGRVSVVPARTEHLTQVVFQKGSVIGLVTVEGLNLEAARAEALSLQRKLEQKMSAELSR